MLKKIVLSLASGVFMLGMLSDAQAVVCARGYRGAGCAGPNGSVAVRRPAYVPPAKVVVVPPARGAVVVPPPAARGGAMVVRPYR